ncbi:VWA domain-containing protein [Tabrizicola sp. J26]|uniref:VWA domain-containing protein n=1 Tax=Alitabrizicola rongguiensis TaxID=2909234 RepID=UPI001F44AFDB|nr:VWA domain-containing protein [Tabrizicola rongguiensis]MCF1710821.1 VWA domain-containing protein [Tabrizicola rongguiensis]
MPCLNLSNGTFSNVTFSTTNFNSGAITITRTASSISVGHSSYPNALVLNGDFRSAVFGSGFVALLRIDGGPGIFDRFLSIVDFTVSGSTPGLTPLLTQSSVSSGTGLPSLSASPGNGSLVFIWAPTTTVNEMKNFAICRSDNGAVVLSGPNVVSNISNTPWAEITASQLIMHYPNSGFSNQTAGPRPLGSAKVVGGNVDFGEAVLGASNPALAATTRTVTLKNEGSDCITINGVANIAPYSLTAASVAKFPKVLAPTETMTIDIVFAPAAPSNSIQRDLTITRTPANGDSVISCKGKARAAVASIATSVSALAFGTVPIPPGTANKNFTVTNNGDLNLTIAIAPPPGGSDFTWAPVAGLPLPVGATTAPQNVAFTTTTDGTSTPRDITVTPSAGTPRTIHCTGAGCIPNAAISVQVITPLTFGKVERGFRTVRFIDVTNTGDADLTFTARIIAGATPAQAANFGLVLPENDITDAPDSRPYSVLPSVRCGPGAVGNPVQPVAVSFFADGANGPFSAVLRIEGHNGTNEPGTKTWDFPLSAEIIDPVPIDISLVLDRSGSMDDPAWSRNKMEAALSGAKLLVQMLRDTAPDRCAVVGFNELPQTHQSMVEAGPNRAALMGALANPPFAPTGMTNIAGGAILGMEQLATAHPANPPQLKKAMVVLTDGMENRCFQKGGSGPWLSLSGADAADGMRRPDNTPQDSDPLAITDKTYAIGIGQPGQISSGVLTAIATATGASYQGAQDLTGKNWFLLEKYFTQIFMETAGLSQISDPFYTISPGDKHPHQFNVLPGDVNAMVVVYDMPGHRLPFHIESPKGEILSGNSLPPGFAVRYRSTPTARFVEFFFPNKEPDRYVGLWTVWVHHDGYVCSGEVDGREGGSTGNGFLPKRCFKLKDPVDYGIAIGAGSNLRLQPYVDPANKYIGDPIRLNAVLSEADLPVRGATVKVRVEAPNGQVSLLTLIDDGTHQDGQAEDGDYGGTFTQTWVAGNYQLTFIADGMQGSHPFHREAHRTKAVLDPRRPPGGGEGDGKEEGGGGRPGGDDCCKALIRALRRQEMLLAAIAKQRG